MKSINQHPPRRALVTGGASGFGLAIAEALLAQGAYVAIGDNHPGRLNTASQTLDNENLLPLELDVALKTSVLEAIESCKTKFGGLDTLVNSAGVIHATPLLELTEEEWDHDIAVDLKGVFLCSQAAAPLLIASGRGRIVNIGSDASKVGFPYIPHYCAAKHGVVGLTKSMAGELAPHKVTVNCVCPVGDPTTAMGQELLQWKSQTTGMAPEEIMADTAAKIPLKRNVTAVDIANAVMFFISNESSFVTGVALDVDGGLLSTVPIPGVD